MPGFSEREIQESPEIFRSTMFKTGIWRARVVSVLDPENRGRVQVRILQLHTIPSGSVLGADSATSGGRVETVRGGGGTEVSIVQSDVGVPNPPSTFDGVPDTSLPWAEPCFPWGGQKRAPENKAPNGNVHEGFYMIPEVGSTVWVAFENGFVQNPVWLGSWYGANELPIEIDKANPEKIRLIKTRIGHIFLFDDRAGLERVFLATADDDVANNDGPRIRFLELDDANETLTLQNSPTQSIVQNRTAGTTVITEGGTSITLTAAGTITITNGTTTITVTPAGDTTITGPGGAAITLGTGAVQGVCLDSLITVINTAFAVYGTHTHVETGSTTLGPSAAMVGPVIGINSSATVTAKL